MVYLYRSLSSLCLFVPRKLGRVRRKRNSPNLRETVCKGDVPESDYSTRYNIITFALPLLLHLYIIKREREREGEREEEFAI